MIVVAVVFDGDGIIECVSVSGHALGLEKGGNIVCAAVTVLVRTAARVLEALPGVQVSGGPGERGEFELCIDGVDKRKAGYVKAVGDYLLRGIKDLRDEFPGDCTIEEKYRR